MRQIVASPAVAGNDWGEKKRPGRKCDQEKSGGNKAVERFIGAKTTRPPGCGLIVMVSMVMMAPRRRQRAAQLAKYLG